MEAGDVGWSDDRRLSEHGRGRVLAEISNRIVQLHKEYYGRGPTKARTYWQEDVVTVVMHGGLTRLEETLGRAGHTDDIARQRITLQEALREDFKREVARLTGRAVVGYMSGVQQDPAMLAEVFVLKPSADDAG